MVNRIMTSPAQLLPQVADAIPGVTKYAGVLGLPADKGTTMATEQAALQAAQNEFLDKVTELKGSQAAKRTALKSGQTLVTLVRELAKPTLGAKFSQNWAAFGFAGSLKIPQTVGGVVSILGTLAGHLTSHPQFGNTNLGLDAEQAGVLKANLLATVEVVNVKKSEVRQKFEVRAEKTAAVRLSLREVLSALHLKFDPLDARWPEFGFKRPGAKTIPGVPKDVTAVLIGTNAISVKWPAVAGASYYRIWLKIHGQDTELLPFKNTSDLDATLEGLPSNTTVEVAVSAANSAGNSAMSTVHAVLTL